jgi:hypothetical protein
MKFFFTHMVKCLAAR